MKSYTDLEQSKKLAEILPLESADMYWWFSGKRYYIEAMDDGDFNEKENIRAWSLSALLGVLPYPFLSELSNGIWKCGCYPSGICYFVGSDSPINACYEMILKLHEQNLL